MFSALKKLVGSEQAPGRDKNIPAGLQSMNQALQRRFAKGVQYNSECGAARAPAGDVDSRAWARGPRRPGLGRNRGAPRPGNRRGPRRVPTASLPAGNGGGLCSSVFTRAGPLPVPGTWAVP